MESAPHRRFVVRNFVAISRPFCGLQLPQDVRRQQRQYQLHRAVRQLPQRCEFPRSRFRLWWRVLGRPVITVPHKNVYWAVKGSAPDRELIVEWRDVEHFNCVAPITFQAVFFEGSSNILFNYKDTVSSIRLRRAGSRKVRERGCADWSATRHILQRGATGTP